MAAAMTRSTALTKIESRMTAMRRSPRGAVTGPEAVDDIDRCGPLRERCCAGALPPAQGNFFSQTKHFPAESSFFAPQKGQKIWAMAGSLIIMPLLLKKK